MRGKKVEFKRQREFQRNENLERLLKEINDILGPVEDRILQRYKMPKYPVIFIVGAPRCGSTLIMQWLAKTDRFAYPTNLLSRFYEAPYIGAKILKFESCDQMLEYMENMNKHILVHVE